VAKHGRDPWFWQRWAIAAAIEHQLRPAPAHALLVLAVHADRKTGKVTIKNETLGREIRREDKGEKKKNRSATEALKPLVDLGLIERRKRRDISETRLLISSPDPRDAAGLDSQPAAGQETADPRDAAAQTRMEPRARPAGCRGQNNQTNSQRNAGSPDRPSRARAREGSKGEGKDRRPPSSERGEQHDELTRRVCSILQGGVDSLDVNDHGRLWPGPKRELIARTLGPDPNPELAERVARETREIVVSQDRAPNISGLFAQQLEKAHRAGVREQITGSLAEAAGGAP
jgi:hypothetical protein